MAFTYQYALVKPNDQRGRWHQQAIQNERFIDLFQHYRDVVIVVSSPYYDTDKTWWLSDTAANDLLRLDQRTVQQFFDQLGQTSLPVRDQYPPTIIDRARYQDAWMCEFDIQPVDRLYNKSMNAGPSVLEDLKLTRDDVDYRHMYESCLATVNGFVHRTNYTGESVNIIDGAKNGFYANQTYVGLIDFSDLGPIQIVDIEPEDIHSTPEGDALKRRVYLNIKDSAGSLEGRSVLLCVGGYLHLPDGQVVTRAGERLYSVDFTRMGWAQRFFDMRRWLDIDYITRDFEVSSVNDAQVALSDLFADRTIRRLFESSQTFFVIVDHPELFLDYTLLEPARLVDTYIAYEPPIYPVISGHHRFQDYWFRHEYDRWVINTQPTHKPQYLFETRSWGNAIGIDDSRYPGHLEELPHAFFWKLSGYRQ